jgi:excisionase family DNA binding protein
MEKHVTATEAARRLGVSLQTVLRRIQSGAIRAERAGQRLWLISTDEIERAERTRRGDADDRPAAPGPAPEGGAEGSPQVAIQPGRLTPESLRRLDEVRKRLEHIRLPMDSTELLRLVREGRYDEIDAAMRGRE